MTERRRRKKLSRRKRQERNAKREASSILNSRAFAGPLDGKRWVVSSYKLGKSDIATFRAKFAATVWLDMLIDEDEVEWVSDTELKTSNGVQIKSADLQEIFKYRLKGEENEFELDEGYQERAAYIRRNSEYIEPPPQESRKKGHSRKGMVLIKNLCDSLRLHPRDARKILRHAGIKKPEHGWAWREHEPQLEQVRKLLEKHANG